MFPLHMLYAGVLLYLTLAGVEGLYCFKCLSLDCPGDDIECQSIRAFIQAELKNLYYFRNYLDPCPPLNETYTWRIMQINDEPCASEKPGEATCTLGRMQVKTTKKDENGKSSVHINHATVMGCANRQLLRQIQQAFEEKAQCDLTKRIQSNVNFKRELQIEHCRDLSTQCYEKDYCIDWKKSVVKQWGDGGDGKKFEFVLVVGMLAVALIVITALLIAGMFSGPVNRPANLPRSIGDELETVKITSIKDKEFSSIEESDPLKISGTGTIGRRQRPSVKPPPPPIVKPPPTPPTVKPPPPPPRLPIRQTTRESTPV